MKTSSAKQKGRRLATQLQALLLSRYPELSTEDIRVTSSGVQGEDLQLSPAARALLPYQFELKNQEKLNIWSALKQGASHGKYKPVVVFKRNHSPTYVCVEIETFLDLITS